MIQSPARCACLLMLLIAFLPLLMGGCSSVAKPTVAVESAALGATSDEAQVLDFALRLDNENREPLELDEFYYTLVINGETVYRGRRSAQATLSARGGKSISIPAVVPAEALAAGGGSVSYALSGRVWYRSPGELADILFDAGLYRPNVSFGTEGRLDLASE